MGSSPPSAPATHRFAVRMFGPFTVKRDEIPLDTASWPRRAGSLLRLLLTVRSRRRTRDELMDALWPDASPEAAYSNLRYVMHQLRRVLAVGLPAGEEHPSFVRSEREWVTLDLVTTWDVDLEAFESMVEAASGRSLEDARLLQEALDVFHDRVLPEDQYEDWATAIREHAERERRDACLRLAEIHRANGWHVEAIKPLERALEYDPIDEEAVQRLLAILLDLGRRTEALRTFQHFETRLRDEIGVPPSAETLALVEALRKVDHAVVAPLPTAPPPRLEEVPVLPSYRLARSGPLLGREREVHEILEMMMVGGPSTPRPRTQRVPASRGQGEVAGQGSVALGEQLVLGRAGTGVQVVMIGAEAGVGKTRLLAEVAARANEMGALVLAGGCYEQEGRLPYGPIHDALFDYLDPQPEALLRELFGPLLADLARIVPELRARLPDLEEAGPSDGDGERLRLFTALAVAIERCANGLVGLRAGAPVRPLVLLLDDLQWADDSTLQVLHFLARRRIAAPVLAVGAYRSDDLTADSPLARYLSNEGEENGVALGARHIAIGSLSRADLETLLNERAGQRCSPSLVDDLHHRSSGNPFFATQILRLLQDERRLEPAEDGLRLTTGQHVEVPAAVRDTIGRRLRHLSEGAQEVLTLGAVLGRDVDYPALDTLWPDDERGLFAALDEAVDARLLRETDTGYSFLHPLLREVVYDRIPGRRRAKLHGRAGRALEALHADRAGQYASVLAHHFAAAVPEERERALRYLQLAGDNAIHAYAAEEAEAHYARALEIAGHERPEGLTHARLYERLGAVRALRAQYEEALTLMQRAEQMFASSGDLDSAARVTAKMGRIHALAGTVEHGIDRIETLLGREEDGLAPAVRAVLYAALSRLYSALGRFFDCLTAVEHVVGLAHQLEDGPERARILADVEVRRGLALSQLGRIEEGRRALEAIIPSLDALGDLDNLARALNSVGVAYELAGDTESSRVYRLRALEIAERMGDPPRTAFALLSLGSILFLLGHWDGARSHYQRALEIIGSLPQSWYAPYPPLCLGQLLMAQGRMKEAARLLGQAVDLAGRTGDVQALRTAQTLLAELDLIEAYGDGPRRLAAESALARLRPFIDGAAPGGDELAALLPMAAWAYLQLGDLDEADGAATHAANEVTTKMRQVAPLLDGLRIQGMIEARRERWDIAFRAFDEGVALARGMPHPYAEARLLAEYGAALAAHGDTREARARLEEALVIFRRLGASLYVERTLEQLERLATVASTQ